MPVIAWIGLSCVGFCTTVWLYVNLHPKFRRNLAHRIESLPREQDPRGDDDLPPVAILVPGRDEAAHLPDTLVALCEQDYPDYRVIFIDDESTDDTPGITVALAKDYSRLTVIRNDQPPPEGWVGKCWAIHRGFQAVGAQTWLCFTDADIHWRPHCLRSAMRHAQERGGDIVAMFPQLHFGGAIEAMVQSQLALALGVLYPMDRAMDPAHPDTLTGGAFILTRRSFYDAVGGHEAVRGEVVDDIELGKALKAAGGQVRVGMAPDLLWCRMYDGWADMWEGLAKNAYAGLFHQWWRVVAMTVVALVVIVFTPVYLIGAAAWLATGGGAAAWWMLGLSVLALLLQARVMNGVRRLLDLPRRYAWIMPIGSAIYLVIAWASVWRYYRGGNVWKGRSYGPAEA